MRVTKFSAEARKVAGMITHLAQHVERGSLQLENGHRGELLFETD
jgi:hypothetical protein